MPALGKEIERGLNPDKVALKEIEGYIDRIERQAETQKPRQGDSQSSLPPTQIPPVLNDKGMGGSQTTTVAKITLPINQAEVEGGLKKSVFEGIRWLSEWCVMMIKKYPGRVFYLPKNMNNDGL